MARVGTRAAARARELLVSPSGIPENLAAMMQMEEISLPDIAAKQVSAANVAIDIVERGSAVKYPTVHVYCEKYANTLREKFRTFSGRARMAVEVRVSQDRLEEMERALQVYVDAVTRVLDQNRGDWGGGMFYTGGYEAEFGPLKHGGKNYVQVGKITFDLEVSLD